MSRHALRALHRLLPIAALSGGAVLFLHLLGNRSVPVADVPIVFADAADAYFHPGQNALFYTPALVICLGGSLEDVTSPLLVVRREGIAGSLRHALAAGSLLAAVWSCVLASGFAAMLGRKGILDDLGTAFHACLLLALCAYGLSCCLLLILVGFAAGRRAAIVAVLGYGLVCYFIGTSPLRSLAAAHVGWTLVQDALAGPLAAAASVLHQLLICGMLFAAVWLACLHGDIQEGSMPQ